MSNPSSPLPTIPLRNEWAFYFDDGAYDARKHKSYLDIMSKLGTFDSVQGFWKYYKAINSGLEKRVLPRFNLRLFKSSIKPVWEDTHNCSGGKWVISCPSGDNATTSHVWREILMAAIGDLFPSVPNLCGLVLVAKGTSREIQVWVASHDRRSPPSTPLPDGSGSASSPAADIHRLASENFASALRHIVTQGLNERVSLKIHFHPHESAHSTPPKETRRVKERSMSCVSRSKTRTAPQPKRMSQASATGMGSFTAHRPRALTENISDIVAGSRFDISDTQSTPSTPLATSMYCGSPVMTHEKLSFETIPESIENRVQESVEAARESVDAIVEKEVSESTSHDSKKDKSALQVITEGGVNLVESAGAAVKRCLFVAAVLFVGIGIGQAIN